MKLHWKIINGVLALFVITMIAFGFFMYKNLKGAFESNNPTKVVASMVSIDLPPGHKAEMGIEIFGFRTAVISREGKKQALMLIGLPAGYGISNEEFKAGNWEHGDRKGAPREMLDKLNLPQFKSDEIQVRDKGAIRLKDGTEVPFVLATFEKRNNQSDGFMGVINFAGTQQTVMVMDMAEEGKYDFETTKRLVELIGPPKAAATH